MSAIVNIDSRGQKSYKEQGAYCRGLCPGITGTHGENQNQHRRTLNQMNK